MVVRKINSLDLAKFIVPKNTLTDRSNAEFHMKTTGRSTVPCLYIDDKPMFESSDICTWLEENKEKIKG